MTTPHPPEELIEQAKKLMVAECERRGYHDAAAYYRSDRCPDDQVDITVVATTLTLQASHIEKLEEALRRAKRGLTEITSFADPNEIADDPGEFWGTDDALETVSMAYENMRFTARNCLNHVEAALSHKDNNNG